MRKVILLFMTIVNFQSFCHAQKEQVHASVEAKATATTGNTVPFWFRSNQGGNVPLKGSSAALLASVYREYDTTNKTRVDWSFGASGRVNAGYKVKALLLEAFGRLKVGVFELEAGRSKQVTGLYDTSLSSGSFTLSGNALAVPHVQVAVPRFSYLLGGKLFAFQGNVSHGWLGTVPIQDNYSKIKLASTYLHQFSLYGRLAKPEWKLQLFGGINHQVTWGSEKKMYEDKFTLSQVQSYLYAVSGKTYQDGHGISSKLGNHLGSIDMALKYNFSRYSLFAYRQNFYDEGALYSFANIRDGLNGISLTNKKGPGKNFGWHKVLLEVLNTKNQAGETWSKYTKSGDENYYNNYVYAEGWSYRGVGLGTPFISEKNTTRKGLPNDTTDYFNNNRVLLVHLGVEGNVKDWMVLAKFSFSDNEGTFGTSLTGHSLGRAYSPPVFGLFKKQQQFSGYLELRREIRKDVLFMIMAAHDEGGLLDRSTALSFSLRKYF